MHIHDMTYEVYTCESHLNPPVDTNALGLHKPHNSHKYIYNIYNYIHTYYTSLSLSISLSLSHIILHQIVPVHGLLTWASCGLLDVKAPSSCADHRSWCRSHQWRDQVRSWFEQLAARKTSMSPRKTRFEHTSIGSMLALMQLVHHKNCDML